MLCQVMRGKPTLKSVARNFLSKRYFLILITASFISLFFAFLKLLSTQDFRPDKGHGTKGSDRRFMLDRHLLFKRLPPDVRETDLRLLADSDVVDLFDRLLIKKLNKSPDERLQQPEFFELHRRNETKRIVPDRTFHFGFVGDSRVRQLFALIYQVIPNYDLTVHPEQTQFSSSLFIPRQMIVHSDLLNSLVSFNWFSLLVGHHGRDIFNFLHHWLGYKERTPENKTLIATPHPDVLIIGLGSHHMLQKHPDAHEDVYFKKLKQLVPLLQNISKYSQVIWLNQYPTLEFFGKNDADNTDVHSQKIVHYNREANKILRNGGIPVWTSGSPIAEEYLRSCLFNKRLDGYLRNYENCRDYIHPGLAAVTDIMQILYNFLTP